DRGKPGQDLDRLTAKLAEKALKSIKSKEYCEPYKAQAKQLVKIGLGVTHQGKCRALIEG
ncbi:MAG: PD-(D/E)XK nuclease domain-containing protein, partial [Deltaproteobacteria bacterium]|nr:PD-(D/E)XK nuclease domain-containing protein [Deltaproteobacteria bacterium]